MAWHEAVRQHCLQSVGLYGNICKLDESEVSEGTMKQIVELSIEYIQ